MFVPGRTHLEPKGRTGASGRRDSFGSLALVGVGRLTVVFDGGYTTLNGSDGAPSGLSHADIVAGSIFFAWSLSYFFGEFNNGPEYTILLSTANIKGGVGSASNPTAIESGDRGVSSCGKLANVCTNGGFNWAWRDRDASTGVGEFTQPNDRQTERADPLV
ncbi:hypothetical protein TcBrA4_0066190 [Trypanosoma cruzi]|nr:hypothetical protein TcBrA4_0066190 [Trypanosoma cruzi]